MSHTDTITVWIVCVIGIVCTIWAYREIIHDMKNLKANKPLITKVGKTIKIMMAVVIISFAVVAQILL